MKNGALRAPKSLYLCASVLDLSSIPIPGSASRCLIASLFLLMGRALSSIGARRKGKESRALWRDHGAPPGIFARHAGAMNFAPRARL